MLNGSAQKTTFENSQPTPALPWQEILDALGLTSKGNRDDDYELIMTTIAYKLEYATSEDEKKYYLDLIQQTENIFTNSINDSSSQAFESMTGASYLSSLNQYFMLW